MAARAVADGLFVTDGGDVRLLLGRCAACTRAHFPAADGCPWCGAATDERTTAGPCARLWLWTTVSARPPGYRGPVPFGFGVVELEDPPLRVVTRLVETDPARLRLGQRMRLVRDTLHVDDDGTTVDGWAFTSAETEPP